MNFSLKCLVILPNIISMFICNNYCACTENNCISTDKNNLNSNIIKQQNNNEFLNIKYEDKMQVQNFLTTLYDKVQQVNNNMLQDKDKQILEELFSSNNQPKEIKNIIKNLKQKYNNIPIINFISNNIKRLEDSFFYKENKFYYNNNEILDLLKSFDNWNLNKPLTFKQLEEIYNITKAINFFFDFIKQHKQLTKQLKPKYKDDYKSYFNMAFVIEDRDFGICINSYNFLFEENNLFKSVIFDKNKYGISGKSLHNFLDAVKLCSTKKLPITFSDEEGKEYKNPYLITNDNYKSLLEALLKDFIYVFMTIYCDDYYDSIETKGNIKNNIKNIFTNEYKEEDLIKIFGKTTIDNVRYVIYLLIDNKMHSNNNELLNRLNDILIDIIENNTRDESLKNTYENLREKITYKNMRRSTSTVQKIFDNIMNYIINNKELKDLFDTLKDEVYDSIINSIIYDKLKIYYYNDNEIKKYGNIIKNYLNKLLYNDTLRSYIIMHSLFPIIKSNKFISSKKKEYNEIKNKKKVDNHNKLINDINSEYVTKVVFDFIQKKRLKQILFAEAENNNLKNNKSNKKDISSKIINNNDQKEYNESNIILQNTILQKKHERDQKEYESDEESEEESEEEDIFYETNNKKMKNKDNNNNDFSNKLIRNNLNQINNITEINNINSMDDINSLNNINNASNISNTNNFNNASNINITTNNSNNINDINNKTNTINNEIFNNK